jgi:CRP-like cAMP-binding protein
LADRAKFFVPVFGHLLRSFVVIAPGCNPVPDAAEGAVIMHFNQIVRALQQSDLAVLTDRLKPVTYRHGDLVAEAGKPITHLLFPTSGMISLVVDLHDGERIEAAMVGYEGVVGGSAVFGAKSYVHTGFAQLPGQGWTLKVTELEEIARDNTHIRHLLIANEQFLLAQAQQTAACNAKHHIPSRMATWLLRATDMSGESDLQLTQEFLAQMMGVQRASVSVIASQLQECGMIRYRRGRVSIIDRPRLVLGACECYASLREHHARLFGREALPGLSIETPLPGPKSSFPVDKAFVGP